MTDKPNDRIALHSATGIAIEQIEPGQVTGLIFHTAAGDPVGIALPNPELARVISLLLAEASKSASSVATQAPPDEITATPVPVTSLGAGPHPENPSEALVAIAIGNLQLTFATELSMLIGFCEKLIANTSKIPRS